MSIFRIVFLFLCFCFSLNVSFALSSTGSVDEWIIYPPQVSVGADKNISPSAEYIEIGFRIHPKNANSDCDGEFDHISFFHEQEMYSAVLRYFIGGNIVTKDKQNYINPCQRDSAFVYDKIVSTENFRSISYNIRYGLGVRKIPRYAVSYISPFLSGSATLDSSPLIVSANTSLNNGQLNHGSLTIASKEPNNLDPVAKRLGFYQKNSLYYLPALLRISGNIEQNILMRNIFPKTAHSRSMIQAVSYWYTDHIATTHIIHIPFSGDSRYLVQDLSTKKYGQGNFPSSGQLIPWKKMDKFSFLLYIDSPNGTLLDSYILTKNNKKIPVKFVPDKSCTQDESTDCESLRVDIEHILDFDPKELYIKVYRE